MSTTAGALIQQHPTNPVHQSEHTSASTKTWAQKYAPIKSLKIQTAIQENGAVEAIFDGAFLGTYDDDALRMKEPAYPPNAKYWRLAYEADGNNYFQAEISNIVLATFAQRPLVIQAAEEKPLTDKSVTEAVDVTYSVKKDTTRMHITIGEMKRCLVAPRDWQTGHLRKQQQSLSQELRGYAYLYQCPQIFCFDNSTLLILQFRAETIEAIKDPDCLVNCWVLPRDNTGGTPLRVAFYRLLVQGFRRCQGLWDRSVAPTLNNAQPEYRQFYNGRPLWRVGGKLRPEPWGYCRLIHTTCGAFYWIDADGNILENENEEPIWDTVGFW